ncbi:PAS/PAC sensor signal transduction histidine kinase [Caloranaerobacter azorensis DSM 13643]|uniref:histidine kinase n=1 Tax=Caloranaerobacter azorensis DSM 13643 TaxID=1121264 RepID=A0A1M5U1A2_9FIRM|nr:ATP-binding protein [Caloranaerobacter azorensis]SHH56817.1 PAS/PAC sensor signal transduction histidine kinase [Caloranaerobacter azorensis DSM 13643]
MQKRIFITFLTLISIGILTTGMLSISLMRINYVRDIEDKLISNAKLIETFIEEQENIDKIDFNELANIFSKKIQARITFINKGGWVIGDSDADIKKLDNHSDRPEVIKARQGKIGISKRYSKSLEYEMIYVAVPVSVESDKIDVIRLSVPLKDISEYYNLMYRYIFLSIVAGLLVAMFVGYRYVKSVTKPIKELTIATRKISSGNFGELVKVRTEDEIGLLADNFNKMSLKLKDTINELLDKNTKLKAILSSMINGVIALDNNKRIILVNPVAEKMLEIKEADVRNKHVLEVLKDLNLKENICELLNTNVQSKFEVEVKEPNNRIFNVYINPIKLTNDPNRTIGVLVIIQDITEIRRLERMRKDFVANVSHELKTPLTSIRGFIETLKTGAVEDKEIRNKFLDIIDIETSRLTNLIEDLLLLSQIENTNEMTKKDIIDVNKAIEEVIQVLEELAKKRGVRLIEKVNRKLPNLSGNKGWFKQMLINLIDNGIKYTPEGGTVTITAYSAKNRLVIKISDTGIGIAEQHLPRLFERFYRVDKARSRKVGGTGLGLAIVKHIVLAFRGEISVKSKVNKGTEFIVSLPLDES